MELTVWILVLVGGYGWANTWHATTYKTGQMTGHVLYFYCAVYAVVSYASATFLYFIIHWETLPLVELPNEPLINLDYCFLKLTYDFETIYSSTQPYKERVALYAFLFGISIPHLLNTIGAQIEKRYPTWALSNVSLRIKELANDEFGQMLMESALTAKPILFTLETGKVYAGMVKNIPRGSIKAIAIYPLFSGFRDDNKAVRLNTSYVDHYIKNHADLNLDAFTVVIPREFITNIHWFDLAVFNDINQDKVLTSV
ncbi:MAG: hypothetical protein VYA55_22630 [Pseudomonadota bacterium]|nr:hypothetical protein [Pseudomonadota bacterium]